MNEGHQHFETGMTTGHPGVDQAMAAVEALGESDLAVHVATFEQAHDALRAALTARDAVAVEQEAPHATET